MKPRLLSRREVETMFKALIPLTPDAVQQAIREADRYRYYFRAQRTKQQRRYSA
jgi:hypothetical protein